MYGGYGGRYAAELASDMWIERNIPGGLNSPTGLALDLMMGGNPNPTYGQRWLGSFGGYESFDGPGGYGGFGGPGGYGGFGGPGGYGGFRGYY